MRSDTPRRDDRNRPALLTILVACFALAVSGCRAPIRLAVEDLSLLDGFRKGTGRTLIAPGGKKFSFDHRTRLRLELRGAPAIQGRFIAIDFDGRYFDGDTGLAQFRVSADEISEVWLGKPQAERALELTAWTIIGLVGVATTVLTLMIVAYFLWGGPSGGAS